MGYGPTAWTPIAASKVFAGSPGTMVTPKHRTNASKSLMQSSSLRPASATSLKMPVALSTIANGLKLTNLNQSNFATFKAGGDPANNGATVLIQLTLA